ncbi:hypothetical protein JOB18_002890, partial [Solea senegalensis]
HLLHSRLFLMMPGCCTASQSRSTVRDVWEQQQHHCFVERSIVKVRTGVYRIHRERQSERDPEQERLKLGRERKRDGERGRVELAACRD